MSLEPSLEGPLPEECLWTSTKLGVTTIQSSPKPAMSPPIASQVFFSLFIALFNSTMSFSFKGLILTSAIV